MLQYRQMDRQAGSQACSTAINQMENQHRQRQGRAGPQGGWCGARTYRLREVDSVNRGWGSLAVWVRDCPSLEAPRGLEATPGRKGAAQQGSGHQLQLLLSHQPPQQLQPGGQAGRRDRLCGQG